MVFNRHNGSKWLADILDDVSASSYKWMKEAAPEKSKTALTWSARVLQRASAPLRRMSAMLRRSSVSTRRTDSAESIPLPRGGPVVSPGMGITLPVSNLIPPTESVVQFRLGSEGRHSGDTSGRLSDVSPVALSTIPPISPGPAEASATRAKFRRLVWTAATANRLIVLGEDAKARVSTSLTDGNGSDQKPTAAPVKPMNSRVAGLVPKVQKLAPTQDIAAHTALVRHMEVSKTHSGVRTPVFDGVYSSHGMGSSWPLQVGIVDRSSSVLGYGAR